MICVGLQRKICHAGLEMHNNRGIKKEREKCFNNKGSCNRSSRLLKPWICQLDFSQIQRWLYRESASSTVLLVVEFGGEFSSRFV